MTTPARLSREDYLARVRSHIPGTLDADAVDDLVDRVRSRLGSEKDDARLKQGLEAFLQDPEGGYAGIVEIFDIGQAREALSRHPYVISNWQYDRTARALLVNLRRGAHETLSANLFRAYRGDHGATLEDAAERFVSEGLGWFKSSAAATPEKSALARLDAQEKAAFRGVEFRDI